MITKIKYIERAGIFKNYRPDVNIKFKRYNLIYGWNGSGKTTLSRLLRNLETPRKIAPNLDNLKYTIEFEDSEINDSSPVISENIRVFNADFISENLTLEQAGANSLLYVGEENIDLAKSIKTAHEKLKTAKNDYTQTTENLEITNKKIDSFFIELGKRIAEFHSTTVFAKEIRSIDKKYTKNLWEKIANGEALNDNILSDSDYTLFANAIQSNIKIKSLEPINYKYNERFFNDSYRKLQTLLETSLVRESIIRLDKNSDIENWVNLGRKLHIQHTSTKCEYCQQTIPSDRFEALEKHFDASFNELQSDLKKFISELKHNIIALPTYSVDDVIIECQQDFKTFYDQLQTSIKSINNGIYEWISLLEQKIQNPNSKGYTTSNIIKGTLEYSTTRMNSIIEYQKEYILKSEEIAKGYKLKIEKHLIANEARNRELIGTEHNCKNLENRQGILAQQVQNLENEVREMEAQLNNETFILEEINDDLHRFIGRSNIKLDSKKNGGYVILRDNEPALNLSEGEKSAIGLIYFIKKLREKENELSNTIVVFDDPISSFDSNHLFQACSYVLTNCRACKQLFILTHNFWFFKISRDWIKNQWEKKDKPVLELVEISSGKINLAPTALRNHHSEYQYIFTKVNHWSESAHIELHDNFILANLCRRLLESFNAFKTASKNGFTQILELAEKEIDITSLNKLKYFLHKYSHLDRIEEFENIIENIQAEGISVAKTTLEIIKKIDELHYNSMIKLAKEQEVGNE